MDSGCKELSNLREFREIITQGCRRCLAQTLLARLTRMDQKSRRLSSRKGVQILSEGNFMKRLISRPMRKALEFVEENGCLPYLGREEFAGLFKVGNFPSARRADMRLQILAALGKCRMLKVLDTVNLNTCELTVPEWEAFLTPLQYNPGLEEVHFHPLACVETEVAIGIQWRKILGNAQGMKRLVVKAGEKLHDVQGNTGPVQVRESILTQLALGLKDNPCPRIEYLEISDWYTGRAAIPIGQIISCLPKLRNLLLSGTCMLEENEVDGLSEGLMKSRSLRQLRIRDAEKGMADVLLKAFSETCTLDQLNLENQIQGLEESLPLLLSTSLTHINLLNCSQWQFDFHKADCDQWKVAGTHFLRASIVKDCKWVFSDLLKSNFECLVDGLRMFWGDSPEKPLINLSIVVTPECSDISESHEFLSVALSNTFLTDLHIDQRSDQSRLYGYDHTFEYSIQSRGIDPGHQKLVISFAPDEFGGVWEKLIPCLQNNDCQSIQRLCLEGCELDENRSRDLKELNRLIPTIEVNGIPWEHDNEMFQGAIVLAS